MPARGVVVTVFGRNGKLKSVSSGVSFADGIVLIHGFTLLPFAKEKWFAKIVNKLGNRPKPVAELGRMVRFEVLEEEDVTAAGYERTAREMVVAGAWNCPVVGAIPCGRPQKAQDEAGLRCFPLFLFLTTPGKVLENVEFILEELVEPVRGQGVIVESTPFGHVGMINSISRGVVCRSLENHPCVFLTDAQTAPCSNSGPIYSVDKDGRKGPMIGIVIGPQINSGGWPGLTLGVALLPVLQRLTSPGRRREREFRQQNGALSSVMDLVDETIILVQCGKYRGTGVVIDASSGTILTCSHVIQEERDGILVRHKGRSYSCELIYKTGDAAGCDLAVIKVSSPHCFTSQMEFADSPAKTGEMVFAAGFPLLDEKLESTNDTPLITLGCVSKTNPFKIQTSCVVLSGHSGGAIIRDGKLLGIIVCNLMYGSQIHPNTNHALPVRVFRHHVEKYLKDKNVQHLKNLETNDEQVRVFWKSKMS
ncbi:UNVERIFIED_CONTAM: hypothetical protein PYX00_000599 [Menopon gallinae]|uniref:Peroxisomal leader peptide-processing protease n=1 Tax=Menopon gallinae TaxID=328185 RepID=A0AAW2IAN0_9NEOP